MSTGLWTKWTGDHTGYAMIAMNRCLRFTLCPVAQDQLPVATPDPPWMLSHSAMGSTTMVVWVVCYLNPGPDLLARANDAVIAYMTHELRKLETSGKDLLRLEAQTSVWDRLD